VDVSSLIANRPQFRKMIEKGGKPKALFQVTLVWRFGRLTRKCEQAVEFRADLRFKGTRVVSINEQAEGNAISRPLVGITGSVDEYYSENLARAVVRGMREAAWLSFFFASNASFGYRKIKGNDGAISESVLDFVESDPPQQRRVLSSPCLQASDSSRR